jgi:hypothetical protein
VRYLAATSLLFALFARAPGAGAAEISVRCSRLEAAELEELRARARLLLRADRRDKAVATVAVECDERRAWVRWSNQGAVVTLPVDESRGVVEGTLDAIEGMVRRLGARPDRAPPEPLPDEETEQPRATAVTPAPTDRDAPGGLGIAVAAEPVASDLWALGPRLDVGFGSGAFSGFATEGFRRTTGSEGALLIDAQIGAAWGAPFAPHHAFGFALSSGLEWLTAALAGGGATSGLTDSSMIASLGARARMRMDSVALWVGADGKFRAAPQELGSPIDVAAPRVTVLIVVGVLFLVAGEE